MRDTSQIFDSPEAIFINETASGWGRGKETLSNLERGLGERQRNPLQFGGWVGGEAKNATSPNTNLFEMSRGKHLRVSTKKVSPFQKVKPLNAGTKKSPTLRRGFQNYPS